MSCLVILSQGIGQLYCGIYHVHVICGRHVASQPACFLLVPFRHAGDALTPGVILRYLSQRPFLVCLMAVGTYVAVVTTGHCLGPFVIAHRDMAHQSGPDIVADESCFDGQRVPGAERAALDAVVFLYVEGPDGRGDRSGTGTIIRNSRTAGGHNRILTVRHVVQHALETHGRIRVIDRYGKYLGEARQDPATILSGSRLAQEVDSAVAGMNGDGAVLLDMVDVRNWYDSIRGLEIVPVYRGILTGWFSDPSALMPGVSGAALLNDRNQVIAVVQAAAGGGQYPPTFRTQLTVHNILRFLKPHQGEEETVQSVSFYHGANGYFMPLSGPGVLETLHLQPVMAVSEGGENVHIFGYPMDMCIAYHGRVYPKDSMPLMGIPNRLRVLLGF